MKCSICHQDRAGDTVITIVNDPPLDICADCCRANPLFEKWFEEQGRLLEIDLIQSGYNYNILAPEYKPTITRITIDKYDVSGYGIKLAFKCIRCGRIYSTSQAVRRHMKSHIEELTRQDLEEG